MGQSKIAGKCQLITPLTYRRELTAQNVGLRIKCWCFLGSFLNQLPDPGVTFLESVGNFEVPGSCFMFDEFALKIKVSIVLKTTQ